ncbi:MAG: tetratricopeptide repeat protein [Chloroflexi bacterium]|nr:tetratricopeptide repeat protein [Chloroflexota bacterium]
MSDPEALKEEGLRLFQEGARPEALSKFQQALTAFESADDHLGAAEMLNNIGVVHRVEGRTKEAAEALEKSRLAFQQAGDRNREAQALGNLAPLYISMEEHDKAFETYTDAAAIFEEIGENDLAGETLIAQGLHQFNQGNRMVGIGLYEKGLTHLSQPTMQQKMLRSMLKLRMRLLFGGS